MTGPELKAVLKARGWTYPMAAEETWYSMETIKSACAGRRPVPRPLVAMLELMARLDRQDAALAARGQIPSSFPTP